MRKTASLFIFLIIPISFFAQTPDTIALEQVSVYSTGIVLKKNESGRNILIIPGSELIRHPALSIDELLRYLPGIEAQSRGPFGVQSDLSMRGATFAQVLVLIDGIRLNDPLTGHFNSYIPVVPAEIDRIEILSGPAAGIYGPDAVGGVIQIFTKTFSNKNMENEKEFEGKLLGGQYGLTHLQLGGNYGNTNTKIAGGIFWNRSDGFPLPTGEKGYFDLRSASFSVAHKLGDKTQLSYRTALDWRNYNAQYFYTASTADSSHETVNQWWNQLRLQHSSGRLQQFIDLGWKMNHDQYVFNSLTPANKHQTDYFQLRAGESIYVNDYFQLQAGIQSGFMWIQSTDRGNHEDATAGIYLLGLVKPLHFLTLNGGIRADYDPEYGLEFLPQVSAAFIVRKFTFRGSAGRATRAADFTEKYVSTQLAVVGALRNLGNPWLKAESAWNYEAGADYNLSANNTFSITAFYRTSTNLIDYVLTSETAIRNNQNLVAGADYLYAMNINSLQTKGLESFYIGSIQLAESLNLHLRLGYTLQRSDNAEHIVSKYISNHSRQLFTTDLSLQRRRFMLEFNGLWKQRNSDFSQKLNYMQKSEYFVCNGSLTADIWKSKLYLTLQMNNIFNENYSDILGARMPGRWIMTGIRWNFIKQDN
jgi:vitamin B12 transporter